MVAVALLFAIYMVRPSPFILDEVDAAMDEGNINRLSGVVIGSWSRVSLSSLRTINAPSPRPTRTA